MAEYVVEREEEEVDVKMPGRVRGDVADKM
jgi:hypothetical protein